jgi:urate oxidase
VLGANDYGKAETRLVHVRRGPDGRHDLVDVNVSVALAGDLEAVHLSGDNSAVLPTDTQKNTVYAFARQFGVGEIEAFGLRLARHFVDRQPSITTARVTIEAYGWNRLGPHSFARAGGEVRTAALTYDGQRAHVVAGVRDLVLLNSTDSEFHGFVVDEYTTLAPTRDRILATAVDAQWRYAIDELDWSATYAMVREALAQAFVTTYSLSLQQTLYAMGQAAIEAHPEVAEVRLSLPNKHHFLVDLQPFGLDNPGEVYLAADRPYGLIEGTVRRAGAPAEPLGWSLPR